MENENMIIEEAVVAEGEEIIIEEVPSDAIDVVVEEEPDTTIDDVEEIVGETLDEDAQEEAAQEEAEEAEESASSPYAKPRLLPLSNLQKTVAMSSIPSTVPLVPEGIGRGSSPMLNNLIRVPMG